MKENDRDELFKRMAALCSRSEHCPADIHKKATTAGLSTEEANEIIAKLKAENFINDERYVKAYVSDKFRFNKWGKVKIKHSLKMKGFMDETIRQGLETIDEEKYRQALLKTMKEKARAVKKKTRYEKMGQIIRFAQNRGFEPELIHRHLHQIVE